jgi:hypothetical protein
MDALYDALYDAYISVKFYVIPIVDSESLEV